MSNYRKQRKTALKPMFKCLEQMLGKDDAGLFLAICLDLLQECCKDVNQRELRTLEIKINDYFSSKFDFEKNEVVEQWVNASKQEMVPYGKSKEKQKKNI